MLTSAQCMVKAAELDVVASQCFDEGDRAGYAKTADGWRRNARMARYQEEWAEQHSTGS